MVFDAHDQAFAFFGGACARGIYDNMSTAVDAILVGKERRFNRSFQRMCSHHLVEPTACTPAAGWGEADKAAFQWKDAPPNGQVENQVKTSREDDFKPRPRVADFAVLNATLRDRTLAHATRTSHPEMKDKSILEVFEDERAALAPWQGLFDGYAETTAAVSKTCLVSFDREEDQETPQWGVSPTQGYSVSASAVGRPVQVRAFADRIVMLQDGAVVGEHARVFGRDHTVYDPWRYVPVLERKPGALRNGAPFKGMALPPAMARVQTRLAGVKGGERQMVDLLVAAHQQGVEDVEAACAEALRAGLRSADAILNILARRAVPAPAETVTPPTHLRLREEPLADCARLMIA